MKQIFALFFIVTRFVLHAQNDCSNAVQVCGNQSISLNVSGGGSQEINNSFLCFSYENNSLWLRFTILTGGTLGFTLIPSSTAITEDYDFMIFSSNATCSNLGNPIRCSSTNPQAAGLPNNQTGMRASSSDVSEGPGNLGDSWVQWLNVNAGESYYLLIDRPIGNAAFTLNWTGSATLKKTDAGTDKVICKGKSVTMNATESWNWTQVSSNPMTVNFSSLTSANAVVSGFNAAGVYKFIWGTATCNDTMQVTVKNNSTSTINQTICQGQSYLGRTTTGTYIDTLLNSVGCDSIRTLNLVVNPSSTTNIHKSICQGETFMGKSSTGTYNFNYKNIYNCDSNIILDLRVNNYSNVTINASICQGQSYNGKTTSGTYKDSFKSVEGCDSIRTLVLTVYQPTSSTIYDTICQGKSSGGHTTAGTYVDVLRNSHNCDSTRTLHLFVKPNSSFTITKAICDGDIFLGRTTTGDYTDTLISSNGCDSFRYLHLYVTKKTIVQLNKIICEGEVFMGRTVSGSYSDTVRTANNCDSIVTNFNLTVIPKRLDIVKTICEGDEYLGYTQTGIYYDTVTDANNCIRYRKLDLTVNPTTYGSETKIICFGDNYKGKNQSGTYTFKYKNVNGCDSFFTLNLTVKPDFLPKKLRDTSTCEDNPIILSIDNIYKKYKWNDDSMTNSRYAKLTGSYVVTVTNTDDCLSTDSCQVHFFPIPVVEIGSDTSIYRGEYFVINPIISGVVNKRGFRWTPKDSFQCDTCIVQQIEPNFDTYIKLFYVDRNNCFNQDSFYIKVLPVFDYGIPNSFSPNGDFVNDSFGINGGPVKKIELSIFNRWGEKVYSYEGQNPAWDGRYKGMPSPMGVYTYMARIYLYGRQIKEKWGTINLIR